MLRELETDVAESVGQPGQVDDVSERLGGRRAGGDRRDVQDRKVELHTVQLPSAHDPSSAPSSPPTWAVCRATSSSAWRNVDADCAPCTANFPSKTNVGTARIPSCCAASNAAFVSSSPSPEAR